VETVSEFTVSNGTIDVAEDATQTVGFAYTRQGGRVFWDTTRIGLGFNDAMNDATAVLWGKINFSTGSSFRSGQIDGHRVASEMRFDKINPTGAASNPHVVLQQWSKWNPWTEVALSKPSLISPAIKPVTSCLVKLTTLGHEVVATLDAGQSKQIDASISEMSIGLLSLYYEDNFTQPANDKNSAFTRLQEFFVGNRNILTSEDYYYWVTDSPKADPDLDDRYSLSRGDSVINVYRLADRIPVRATKFDESFSLNTAIPLWYDGGFLNEVSIPDQPEIVEVQPFTGDGITAAGYQELDSASPTTSRIIQVLTGFYDQQGNIHRSAPSFPMFILKATAASTTTEAITVTATPALTASFGQVRHFMEFYVGDVGEAPQLAASRDYTPGTKVVATFFINTDPASTANDLNVVRSSKFVYTEGNVLPADPWPSFSSSVANARRLFAASITVPGTLFHSKAFNSGIVPEFSAALTISIGNQRHITALGTIDDKIVVFQKNGIHVVYGSGPDNTGANGDFIVEEITTPLGCEDPESVLTIPDGVMFFSSKTQEFHLLTRDLQIVDIGKPVSRLSVNIDVNASVVYPDGEEARFYVTGPAGADLPQEFGPTPDTGVGIPPRPPRPRFTRNLPLSSGSVLVYNYQYGKWSVLSGQDLFRVTEHQGKIAGVNTGWQASILSEDWFNSELMTWETPWIKVNQLQDFGRFYKATFIGRYLSSWADNGSGLEAGDLQITILYDYEDNSTATTDVIRLRAQEVDPVDGERFQFNVRPGRQKCQAVKFRIEEIATTKIEVSEPTYANGQGIDLVSVDLHYGAKGGSSRNFGQSRMK